MQPRSYGPRLLPEFARYTTLYLADDAKLSSTLRKAATTEPLRLDGRTFPKGSKIQEVHEPNSVGAQSGARGVTVGEGWTPEDFFDAAIEVEHPFQQSACDPKTASAIFDCLSEGRLL